MQILMVKLIMNNVCGDYLGFAWNKASVGWDGIM